MTVSNKIDFKTVLTQDANPTAWELNFEKKNLDFISIAIARWVSKDLDKKCNGLKKHI